MPTHEGKKHGQLFVLPKEELRHFRKLTPEEAARFREAKKEKKKQPEEGEITLERAAEFEEKSLEYIEKLLAEGADKDRVAQGLAGDHITFVWRLR